MSTMSIDSMNFMPSDVARLVLGYLLTKKYVKTYKMLIHECKYLEEYLSLKRKGMNPPLTVYGLDLEKLLDDYAALKAAEHQRYDVGTDSLWKQFDILTQSLKAKTSARQLKMQGDNQSTRMRRMLADNRKRLCLKKQLRSVQNKLKDCHVSPDSNSKSPETAKSPSFNFGTTHSEEDVDNIRSEDDTAVEDSVIVRSFNDTFTTCTDSEVMEVHAASPLTNTISTVVNSPGFTTVREQSVSHQSKSLESCDSQEENPDKDDQSHNSDVAQQIEKAKAPVLDPDKESPQDRGSSKPTEISESENKASEKMTSMASRSTGRRRRGRGRNFKADTPSTGGENRRVTRSAKKNLQFPSSEIQCAQITDTSMEEKQTNKDDERPEESCILNEPVTANNPVRKPEISLNKASSICDKTSCNVDTNVSSDKEHSGISAVSQEPLSNMPLSNMESSRQINQSSNSVLPLHLNSEIMDHSGVLLQTNEPSCSVTNSGSDIVVNNKQSTSTISKAKGQEVVSSLGDGTPENIAQNVAAVTEPNTDHLNKRKRHLRKKQGTGKIGDRKNLLQNENSMDTEDGSKLSSVYDSNIPTFYEQILNNPLLHEKLAQNINKQLLNNSLNKSKDRSTHNASADMSAGPSQLTDSIVLASDVAKSLKDATEVFSPKPVQAPDKQMSNSLNTDLHDILDLHETRMSEGTVAGILDMTKSDPLFESLFNLFAPYSADPASESNLPQKTDFSGITLEMGKEAKTDNSTCKGDKVRSRHNTSKNSTANISMPSFTDCPEPSHTSSEENLIMEILQSPQVNSCLKTSEDVEMTSPVKEHTLSSASVTTTTVSDLLVSSSHMTTDSSILPVTTAGMSYLTSSANHSLHEMGLHTLSSLELCSSQHTLPFSQTATSSVQLAIHSSHTAIQTGIPAIQSSQSNHHTIHSTGSPVVHSPAVYDVVSSSPFHSPITSACSPVSRAHKIGEMGCMSRSPLCGEKLNQLQEQQEILLGESRSECDKLTNNTCLNDIKKKSLDQNLHNRGAVAVCGTSQEMEVTSSSSQDLQELPSTSVSLPVFPMKSLLFTDSQSNITDSESQERYKCTVTQSQGLSILSLKETNEEKARKSRKKSKSRSLNSSKEDNGPKEISYTSFLNEVQEAENSSTPVVTKTVSMTTREEVISPQESITKEMMSFVTMLKEGLNPKRNAKPKVKTPKAQAKKGRKRNEDKKPKPKVLKDQWSPDLKALVQIVTAEKSPVDQKKSPPKRNKKAEKSPINDRKAAPTTCTQNDRIQSKGRSPCITNLTQTLNKVSDDIKVQDLPIVKMSQYSVSENEADQSRITPPSVHSCSDSRSKDNLMEVSYLGYETDMKQKECDKGQNEEENPLPRISLFKTSVNTQNSKSMDVCSGTVHCEPKELDSSITSNYVESPKSIENDLGSTADQCVSGKSSEEDEGCSEKSSLTSISSIKMSLLNKLKKSAEKKLESALKSKHSSQSEQRHVHFDSENDETDGNICLSSVEGDNKILSMPTLDSLITNQVTPHSLAKCSTSKKYRQSKVVQEQYKVVNEFSNSTIGPQIGCETAQPVMSAQNYVTPTGCVVQKQTESECDYSKIMYSENQDFLELGSPSNTVNSTDCDSPAISNIRTSLSESFAGTSGMRQSLGVMVSNSVEEKLGNVIDIHFCSPDSLQNSVASQNIMYGDQIVGSVPVNTVIQNIGGNPGNTNSALPQQIVILPPQQNIAGNIIDISLPTAVSSSALQQNLTQTEVQPQMSFTISDPNLVTTKSSGSVLACSSLQSEQQLQMGGVLTQDFVMSEQYRDVIAQYNADAQESGNKLIAVPVGMQVPNKNFNVKSLNFGPEAEEKVRQLGFGRGRKKSVEEKKARKDRNTQNMQNWRRRQKTKEGETQQNTKVKERRLRGKKSDTADLIPDKSLTVFMDEGDVQLKEMPKKPSLDPSRQNVEIDNSDFIPDNSGMVFLNQKKVTRVKVPTTARKNSSFRKPLVGKFKSNLSIDKSPNVINSVIPQSFSETPSTRQPQLLSKKLIFNMEDYVQNDQLSISTNLSGNVSQAQNSQNVVCTTESSGTEISSRSNIIRRSSVSSVIKPQDLQKKAVEQENSDDSDIDVDGEWECTLKVKNAESHLNDLVCDKLITDSNTTTENSAVTASIVSQSDQVSSLSKVPSRRCSGNNSLFSIQCNYGDSSEDNSDSATEDDLSDSLGRKKFSSQNQHDSFAPKGNSVTASSNLLHIMYTTGTVSSAYATFANAVEELSGRNEQNHSSSLGTIQASAKSIENDHVCQNPSVGTMIVHSGSPCSSIYSENNGPQSVESVSSSLGASPWSTGSIQSPSSVQEGQKSKFNLLMTPPKKRITATLKSGEGFYYYHSSSAAKENSTLPVTPEKQECDKSLKVLPKSPKTPKGKRTPVKFDSVRRSPRLVMSPSQRIRSQLAVSGASAPGSDKKRNNLFGVKRAREESSEHIERKTKKAKAGKKTVDLGKVDLDKFLSKIHKK